jgi:hypothetical protein
MDSETDMLYWKNEDWLVLDIRDYTAANSL